MHNFFFGKKYNLIMKMNPWIIWRHVSNIRNEHSKWKVDTVFMFDLIHQKWSKSVSRELMGHIIWQICNTQMSVDKKIKWDISVFLSNVLWSLFVPIHFGVSVTTAVYYKRIWDIQIFFTPQQDFFSDLVQNHLFYSWFSKNLKEPSSLISVELMIL